MRSTDDTGEPVRQTTASDTEQLSTLTFSLNNPSVLSNQSTIRAGHLNSPNPPSILSNRTFSDLDSNQTILQSINISTTAYRGERYELTVARPRGRGIRGSSLSTAETTRHVASPMPGRVVRVLAEAGQEVDKVRWREWGGWP